MNYTYVISCLLVMFSLFSSQHSLAQEKKKIRTRTFKSCDVEKATEPINPKWIFTYDSLAVIQFIWKSRYYQKIKNPDKVTTKKKLLAIGKPTFQDNLLNNGNHALLIAAYQAYADHYPLVISPDVLWLTIIQGFNDHISLHAEQLRHHFVEHQGKKNIHLDLDKYKSVTGNIWEYIVYELTDLVDKYVANNLVDLVQADFSTTDKTEQIAFKIALLDAVDDYFTYSGGITCGIPEIIIEGTPKDWKLLIEKTEQLAKYELDWWVDDLRPILQECLKASKGRFNRKFWSQIYNMPGGGCTSMYITGWIAKFFPYIKHQRNKMIGFDFSTVNINQRQFSSGIPTLKLNDIPNGISEVDFILDDNGFLSKKQILSGFIGVHQDPKTLALQPIISWGVIDTGEPLTKEDLEGYDALKHYQKDLPSKNDK